MPESHYDLIVVGSGIAGLYAALLAAPHARVLLVTKGSLEESNTRYAQGGIAVALAGGDSPELHLRDTIAAGDGLCNAANVAVLTRDAPECILDLLDRGVAFDREGTDLAWTLEAAHSRPRVLHAGGDATGASVERTLAVAVRGAGVAIQEEAFCTQLLSGRHGIEGIELLTPGGDLQRARAGHVILATGGAGQLYSRTTNPAVATGDGLALAYRAGAQLMDLEFMQFHPTALALEGAPSFLISEAVRGEGGILRDDHGRAFMADYHPARELAPRDVVARAIHDEITRTGTRALLDVTHLDRDLVERRFPSIVAFCRCWGIDPVQVPIPVSPAAHYLMGGILTDAYGRTTLPGLYACGETACTGVHGANRLASNSLLEGLVFARRAVHDLLASGWTTDPSPPSTLTIHPPLVEDATSTPISRHLISGAMWQHAGVIRSAESLTTARTIIEDGREQDAPRFDSPLEARETDNLSLLARLTLRSAELREESRGGHFRADFPDHDPAWQRHILVSKDGFELTGVSTPETVGAHT